MAELLQPPVTRPPYVGDAYAWPTPDLACYPAPVAPPAPPACDVEGVNGKVIEGHVPAAGVKAFLKKPGQARGIGVGGMPTGSPGMEAPGYAPERYDVMSFGEGAPARFMTFVGADPA